jgi:DNA gyrase subunit A
MAQTSDRIVERLLEDEVRQSFLDYSMSVIVQRALPDVRDGLKPVHRRILMAMVEAGLLPGRPWKKSATVVGDVLGKYHPHGDMAVYDALVRMVQPFALRYPLVEGQGNFGSVDGDGAAAYRYTEVRLAPLALEVVGEVDEGTVPWVPNFDDRLREPVVLAARFPHLIVNGASGIAVGMATNIPPHRLEEVVAACVALLERPELSDEELLAYVPGPDFPTGGLVYGRQAIADAYRTGRGKLVVRARVEEERHRGGRRLVVTEIPYSVNKSRLVEQIAERVRERAIEGVADLRDESDREGIRVVIDLKRDADPAVVRNQLFKHTALQTTFGVILLALVDGVPRVLSLKRMLELFLEHRLEVIRRRTQFRLDKAEERAHVLEGLKVAVDHIDEVIGIIRAAASPDEAGRRLRERFELSERQSQAILDMRLARLTQLQIDELERELAEVRATVADLRDILARPERQRAIVREELLEIAKKYGDERRTEIVPEDAGSFDTVDLVPDEEVVVLLTHRGYAKRMSLDEYRRQGRGGIGLNGITVRDEDWVEHLYVARTHDTLLVFTRRGRVYGLPVHALPEGRREAKGKALVNLLPLAAGEGVSAIVPVRDFEEDAYLLFATRAGLVKKTSLADFAKLRSTGAQAIVLEEGDELIGVDVARPGCDVILVTREGMAIRFAERDVRPMGRVARGVIGIRLTKKPGDAVVGMVVPREDSTLLVVTERGVGKRTALDAYRRQARGGSGLITLRVTERTGRVIAVQDVRDSDEVMLITRKGKVIRQRAGAVRVIGRATQGVRLMRLEDDDTIADVARIARETESAEAETCA